MEEERDDAVPRCCGEGWADGVVLGRGGGVEALGVAVAPQCLNSCNLALIMNEIMSLNQVWMNSIKSYPNSKNKSESYFSFEFS
jgi:hypothetical protein